MAQLSGVTLNQVPLNASTVDASVESFDEVYGSLKSASPAEGPSARPMALPPAARVSPPTNDAEPRLDLRTSAETGGTRIDATLQTNSAAPKSVSLFVDDASAESVTQALSDILDSAEGATALSQATDPELAEKLLVQLRLLLEDLAALFPGLALDFFTTLPPMPELPGLEGYTFVDIYDQRLWQMAWSAWDGSGTYSMEDMFQLSLQSATLSSLALSFNNDIIDAMTQQQNAVAS